ncbi:MAG: hypothetical protein KGQ38_05480 [Actinomycetales bacterium]|nr:hypothetical protein [Actinomycetales bacterium]
MKRIICWLLTFSFVAYLGATQTAQAKPRTYVVALVSTSGGFVMPSYNFTRMPKFVIYSNGQMISTNEITTQQYPGRALPSLRTKNVSFDLRRIVKAFDDANLTNPKFDWGYPPVADVFNTDVLTQLSAQKRSAKVSIYALGMNGPGLKRTQIKYRKRANQLIEELQDFSNKYIWTKNLPVAWTPTKYLYQVQLAEPTENSNTLDWIGSEITEETNCAVLSTADSEKITSKSADINVETLWNSGGKTWRVNLRPLLPHESGCKSIGY